MTLAYFGELLIFSSAVTVSVSALFYLLAWRGKEHFTRLARYFFYASGVLIVSSISLLMYFILSHDFTIAYVYSYSSTDLPFGYLVSTLWGGQEGTFLLWIFFISIMSFVMIRTAGEFEKGNMFFVNLVLLSIIIILIKKSPFELMPVFRSEGAGLNPLLQNFWMQIHPPIMFVGFAGVVFPFVFAMTALVEKKFELWAESARRWTIFAWFSLGTSLVMGGYWAYLTLGWGGFWAWDPVENSSFIPWIFLAAQIHVLFIKRVRRGLMRFSLFMVSLSFWSVLYGTFLTRSGVLADFSVHSFVDLGINNFLIGGLFFFILLGLFLIFYRWKEIKPNPSYSQVASKSYMVTLGILVLFIGGVLTLLGTSAPLLTRVADEPSAVGLDYYFITMTPIAIAVLLLLGLFPAFRWNKGMSKPKIILYGGSSALLTIVVLMSIGFTFDIMYLLLFGSAAFTIVSNTIVLYDSYREKKFVPGYLAHVGMAIALIGAGVSAGFETKKNIQLPMHEEISDMSYTMRFTKIVETAKGFDCHVDMVAEGRQFTAVLPHEFPKNQEGVMRKPHVEIFWDKDIYVAPVGMEKQEGADPTIFEFEKGQTQQIDKYQITFHDYDMSSHAEEGVTTAGAKLTVAYDGKSEEVVPFISVEGDSVDTQMAQFDYNAGTVFIAGIQPETGSVLLKIIGDFIPQGDFQEASLIIELSRKPLISLFWIGTFLCFLSGGLSLRKRYRRNQTDAEISIDIDQAKKEMVS